MVAEGFIYGDEPAQDVMKITMHSKDQNLYFSSIALPSLFYPSQQNLWCGGYISRCMLLNL
ncbi:MAG: hypothetical protein A2W63_00700 [Deltaproteobacteria bacterium RIFCSPLOWO2_02_44_9]|nr:MAG: hypothetical protein A2W63_00700 [Deltaproteobacteria bacterium RIFCSPLOWO2_02_44_9]